MKVTIVGAGNVGATCADAIAYRRIASEIVLLDISEGFAEGKALRHHANTNHFRF
jgi:malate dehydrogenase